MGALRLKLGKDLGLVAEGWAPLWVTDFPMFEWDDEENRFVALHHPFTAPAVDAIEDLRANAKTAVSRGYDMVLNGNEIGGGSIRIHNSAMQSAVFELLGIGAEEAEGKFGFLLDALKYGAPPHGGIAFGIDRIAALMAGTESIRDVIAFPKTTTAQCLMTGAPSPVPDAQLAEVHVSGAREARHVSAVTSEVAIRRATPDDAQALVGAGRARVRRSVRAPVSAGGPRAVPARQLFGRACIASTWPIRRARCGWPSATAKRWVTRSPVARARCRTRTCSPEDGELKRIYLLPVRAERRRGQPPDPRPRSTGWKTTARARCGSACGRRTSARSGSTSAWASRRWAITNSWSAACAIRNSSCARDAPHARQPTRPPAARAVDARHGDALDRRALAGGGLRHRSLLLLQRRRRPGPRRAAPDRDASATARPHIVAHSLGGLIALQALRDAPHLPVRRMVCLGSPLGGSGAAAGMLRWPMAGAAARAAAPALLRAGFPAGTAQAAGRRGRRQRAAWPGPPFSAGFDGDARRHRGGRRNAACRAWPTTWSIDASHSGLLFSHAGGRPARSRSCGTGRFDGQGDAAP